tara:strand:+ start:604 stop:990 length:387 start_codon:yes stop_codon:yes gene_type:complete
MKIIGNGVDIVKNSRIKRLILNKKFIQRIYSRSEINFSKKITNKEAYFAKRFAAKEAFVKSLGTGFRNDLNFKDISIVNTAHGKPKIVLSKRIKKIIDKKLKLNKFKIFLSLSDEKKYSIAFVVINKN